MFDISWFYNGLENFKTTVTCNMLFKTIGIVAIFMFVKDENDLVLYILIMAITTMLANLSMWIYLPHYVCKITFKSLMLKDHFKQTLMYFIPTIATSIYTVLDKTLIGVITQMMHRMVIMNKLQRLLIWQRVFRLMRLMQL